MEHNDLRHKLSEYLDGAVTPYERAEIDAHLKTCPECHNAFEELQKTLEQIKSVAEVEPPAWMTQKIMATVRAEAEKKQGIVRSLFFPFSLKLPLQTVVVAFLAITAFYIYQSIQPTAKYAEAPIQAFHADKKTPSSESAGSQAPRTSQQLQKETPAAVKDRAAEPRERNEAELKSFAASAPATPAEQPAPEKKGMLMEKRAVAPQTAGTADMQEQAAPSADAAGSAKTQPGSLDAYKGKTERRFEKVVLARHSNGSPSVVVTYEIIASQKVKLAEERFNLSGERHGMHRDYYASGRIKSEVRYENGALEGYEEYGPDGSKKTGASDHDWFWLRK